MTQNIQSLLITSLPSSTVVTSIVTKMAVVFGIETPFGNTVTSSVILYKVWEVFT
jgi:molybdopterin-binding protein